MTAFFENETDTDGRRGPGDPVHSGSPSLQHPQTQLVAGRRYPSYEYHPSAYVPQHVHVVEQFQLNVSPLPEIVHPQLGAFHENTPPRSDGLTDMVNGFPPEAEIVTGRRTLV